MGKHVPFSGSQLWQMWYGSHVISLATYVWQVSSGTWNEVYARVARRMSLLRLQAEYQAMNRIHDTCAKMWSPDHASQHIANALAAAHLVGHHPRQDVPRITSIAAPCVLVRIAGIAFPFLDWDAVHQVLARNHNVWECALTHHLDAVIDRCGSPMNPA